MELEKIKEEFADARIRKSWPKPYPNHFLIFEKGSDKKVQIDVEHHVVPINLGLEKFIEQLEGDGIAYSVRIVSSPDIYPH